MKINTSRQEGIRTGGGGVIKINNEDRRKGEKMREESRKKETKKNDGRIQSESQYICYCVAVLPINRLQSEDGPICPLMSEKCPSVLYSFLFLKDFLIYLVPG